MFLRYSVGVSNKLLMICLTALFVLGTLSFSTYAVKVFAIISGLAAFLSVGGCSLSQRAWLGLSPVVVQNIKASSVIRLSGLPIFSHFFAVGQSNFEAAANTPQISETFTIRSFTFQSS